MTKQSAFDALCRQHRELLTAYGPFGWGQVAIEVAQDEQQKLLSSNSALYAALEGLEGYFHRNPNVTASGSQLARIRTALALARGGVDGQGAGVDSGRGEKAEPTEDAEAFNAILRKLSDPHKTGESK